MGTSAKILGVKELLAKLAVSDCNVLITGDTGTGKELAARLIHDRSRRSSSALVSINCAAIPDTLIESELFGHEKGSFTGAWQRTDGRIMEANHGTLFLDEVGEMNLYAQAKILRALETRRVQRVGAKGSALVDVRFVAATNQSLERLVNEGRFRKDLYYRLNVAQVSMPSLKERRSDIVLLARHFLTVLSPGLARPPERFSEQVLCSLTAYDWPGNVRELKNAIEYALIHQGWPEVELGHLPEHIRWHGSNNAQDDRARILEVLQVTNWNKSEAAKRLHWSRMTLYRKMSLYSISDQARSAGAA